MPCRDLSDPTAVDAWVRTMRMTKAHKMSECGALSLTDSN